MKRLSPVTSYQSPVTAFLRHLCSSVFICGSKFFLFLQGATGLASPEARCTLHEARSSYAQHLNHKYSRPTRCC